jgi:hypothetical protein
MNVCCEKCVCCQVEVSAMSWSPVQRSPTVWCVVEWCRNFENEEALTYWGLSRKKIIY